MSALRIGSLFSGYGGLDMAVQSVIGGQIAWHVEYDKGPSAILAHHYPDIPNYGDVTAVDFTAIEPVDVLTGGYPCQPFSHAGNRKGTDDERHLWPHVLRAIREVGPRLVILENVRGHLSLGFDTVLADLAGVGWSAVWGVVRAADAGACHQRARLFIVAYPDGAGCIKHGRAVADGSQLATAQHSGDAPADASSRQLARTSAVRDGLSVVAKRGHQSPADASGERHGRREDAGVVGRVGSTAAVVGRSTSPARKVAGDRGAADAADADSASSEAWGDTGYDGDVVRLQSVGSAALAAVNWGDYGPAIARWAHVIGRPAPAPTESGRNGRPRLSPAFVRWMMGLPAGWVTDPAIGISRTAQLKALGNGVVPQQAALALSMLLQLVVANV